ncbi:unnamed protein product [Cercospora beticola]|nr:unnamed protein product [Cercospora beticola]
MEATSNGRDALEPIPQLNSSYCSQPPDHIHSIQSSTAGKASPGRRKLSPLKKRCYASWLDPIIAPLSLQDSIAGTIDRTHMCAQCLFAKPALQQGQSRTMSPR